MSEAELQVAKGRRPSLQCCPKVSMAASYGIIALIFCNIWLFHSAEPAS